MRGGPGVKLPTIETVPRDEAAADEGEEQAAVEEQDERPAGNVLPARAILDLNFSGTPHAPFGVQWHASMGTRGRVPHFFLKPSAPPGSTDPRDFFSVFSVPFYVPQSPEPYDIPRTFSHVLYEQQRLIGLERPAPRSDAAPTDRIEILERKTFDQLVQAGIIEASDAVRNDSAARQAAFDDAWRTRSADVLANHAGFTRVLSVKLPRTRDGVPMTLRPIEADGVAAQVKLELIGAGISEAEIAAGRFGVAGPLAAFARS